jgi:hypothetical protein
MHDAPRCAKKTVTVPTDLAPALEHLLSPTNNNSAQVIEYTSNHCSLQGNF